jgi:SAM-dependent methyltransferase
MLPAALLKLLRRWRYPGSGAYWEKRYAAGGNSGSGSEGQLGAYKAKWINQFVQERQIRSVVEFGCGDGRQTRQLKMASYTGLDVSPTVIAQCKRFFSGDSSRNFELYLPDQFDPTPFKADLSLSMEVIFHLTEEPVYEAYIRHLFAAADRYVVIFSSDQPDRSDGIYPHFRSRHFTADIPRLAPGWILTEHITNPHRDISISDFFIFQPNGS